MLKRLKSALRGKLLARAGGLDLTQVDKIPDSLSWPLDRDGTVPTPKLAETRQSDPVKKLVTFLGLDVWLVTGDAQVREVLGSTAAYSNDIRPFMGKSGNVESGDFGGLGFTDPPEHTRQRRFLTPEFTMRRLERLRPMIKEIVNTQLDELEAAAKDSPDGVVDLSAHFAFPVPFNVVCDLLGVPRDNRDTLSDLATARFDISKGGMGAVDAIGGSREFLLAETARQWQDPGPGLIGQIVREHKKDINAFDLGGLADGVFTGGLETSASMLALGTVVLLEQRQLWEQLLDPEKVAPIVEELLRTLTPVQVAFPRFAKEDVTVGGKHIPKGSVVITSLTAANRDPATSAGDEIDIAQANRQHLAFGYGFHRCVGAELARMELQMAFPMLVARFPDMQLAVPADDLDYRKKSIVYGVESLPVRLS